MKEERAKREDWRADGIVETNRVSDPQRGKTEFRSHGEIKKRAGFCFPTIISFRKRKQMPHSLACPQKMFLSTNLSRVPSVRNKNEIRVRTLPETLQRPIRCRELYGPRKNFNDPLDIGFIHYGTRISERSH